jgi:hypothetical protein
VGEFLKEHDIYGKEIKQYLPENLDQYNNKDKCQVEFEITIGKSKKTGTFSQMVAAVYPATTHFKNELVLLDKRPNSKVKFSVGFASGL